MHNVCLYFVSICVYLSATTISLTLLLAKGANHFLKTRVVVESIRSKKKSWACPQKSVVKKNQGCGSPASRVRLRGVVINQIWCE